MLLALALAMATAAFGAPAAARVPATATAFLLVPGWTLIRLAADIRTWLGVSLAVPLSLAVETLIALAMVWTHHWLPIEAAVTTAGVSVLLLAVAAMRPRRGEASRHTELWTRPSSMPVKAWALPSLAVGVGIGLWIWSVTHTDTTALGFWGLLPQLGWPYYAGLCVFALTLICGLSAKVLRWPAVALPFAGLIVALYATAPAVEDAPRYSYVYKHIGVTRYIEAHGGVDAHIDIYHRWPGFFSVAAWLSEATGVRNPVSFAAWAEVLFLVIPALLVWALGKVATGSSRIAWTAAAIFVAGNWVGQNYFAPQSSAYVLLLLVALMAFLLAKNAPSRIGLWLERLLIGMVRPKEILDRQAQPESENRFLFPRPAMIAVLLCADAAIIPTHQLTPISVAVTLAVAAVAGYLRPRWIAAVVIALTAAYLVPNLRFLEGNFGLYSSFNPLANASHTTHVYGHQVHDKMLQAQIAQATVMLVWLLALVSMIVQARAGYIRRTVWLGVWTWTPFFILAGQDYGGEARLRVFLYSLPFAAIAIAWLFHGIRTPRLLRTALLTTVLGLTLVGFLSSYLGREDLNQMPRNEVVASQWVYDHAPAGSVLMLSVPNFPTRYGSHYDIFVGPNGEDTPNLLLGSNFADRTLRPARSSDIDVVASTMAQYSKLGYIVFSTSQERMARAYQIFGDGGVDRLEAGVRRSHRFRLVYSNPDARLYQRVYPKSRP